MAAPWRGAKADTDTAADPRAREIIADLMSILIGGGQQNGTRVEVLMAARTNHLMASSLRFGELRMDSTTSGFLVH